MLGRVGHCEPITAESLGKLLCIVPGDLFALGNVKYWQQTLHGGALVGIRAAEACEAQPWLRSVVGTKTAEAPPPRASLRSKAPDSPLGVREITSTVYRSWLPTPHLDKQGV